MSRFPALPDQDSYEAYFLDEARCRPDVEALCEARRLRAGALERMPGGSNMVYALDDARVLKVCAPLHAEEAMAEVAALEVVSQAALGLPTPELLAHGEEQGGWRWLVMTRLPGVVARSVWHTLDHAERLHIITQLGAWIAASHASAPLQALPLSPLRGDWPTRQRWLREGLVARQARYGASALWLDQIAPYLSDWAPIDSPTTIQHADLHTGNLMVRQAQGRWRLSGLLDFADARRAPALYDIASPLVSLARGDAQLVRALLEAALGEDAARALDARVVGQWVLLHEFSHLPYYARLDYMPEGCETIEAMMGAITSAWLRPGGARSR